MKLKVWLPAAIGVLTMGVAVGAANAAPVNSVGSGKAAASEITQTEQVRHRCYRHRGHWHCPRHSHYYGPSVELRFGHGHRRHRHHHHH